MTKVCLYTICKNERHEVEGWWDSAKEADYVIVLDTGSTDGTDEALKKLGAFVERKEFDEFRFDEARNESLKWALETDADVFVNLDMDERLNEGWADILREKWTDEYTRGCCTYWCESPENPGRRNWIHNRDWSWHYPVHETLYRDGKLWYTDDECLDLEGEVIIHHDRKPVKETRNQYLKLIEQRWEEDKPHLDSLCYLVREWMYANMPDKTIAFVESGEMPDILEGNIGSWICTFVAWAYEAKRREDESMSWLWRGWRLDPTCRTAPVSLARLLCNKGMPHLAQQILLTARFEAAEWNVNCMFYDADDVWTWRMDDWIGVTYSIIGDYGQAVDWFEKALSAADPDDIVAVNHVKANLDYARKQLGE